MAEDINSPHSPFLNLPIELRLIVYDYLVVADKPLRGKASGAEAEQKNGLHLAILRVNHEIHEEAKHLFYGKNTFIIFNAPPLQDSETLRLIQYGNRDNPVDLPTDSTVFGTTPEPQPAGSRGNPVDLTESAFNMLNPPLHCSIWPLLRHLTVNIVHTPPKDLFPTTTHLNVMNPRCALYISTLAELLERTGPALRTFNLLADSSYTTFDWYTGSDPHKSLLLTAIYQVHENMRFVRAVAAIQPKAEYIALHCEFKETYFDVDIKKQSFLQEGFLLLASQIYVAAFTKPLRLIQGLVLDGVSSEWERELSDMIKRGGDLYRLRARAGLALYFHHGRPGPVNVAPITPIGPRDTERIRELLSLEDAHPGLVLDSGWHRVRHEATHAAGSQLKKVDLAPLIKLLEPDEWWVET